MNRKKLVAFGIVIISLMMIVPVFSSPINAVEKNPNLSYVTAGEETFLVTNNGAGTKKAWCVNGPNEGEVFVYLDTNKLGEKAVEQKLAKGWKASINTAPGFIYKCTKDVTQNP